MERCTKNLKNEVFSTKMVCQVWDGRSNVLSFHSAQFSFHSFSVSFTGKKVDVKNKRIFTPHVEKKITVFFPLYEPAYN